MGIPDWLFLWFAEALVGYVYADLRAVAIKFDEDRHLTVRYYVDREPKDDDYDRLDIMLTEVLSNTSSNQEIPKVDIEVVKFEGPLERIDPLDRLVFARADDNEFG